MKSMQFVVGNSQPPQSKKHWTGPTPRFTKKVAILGGAATTLRHAPWHDESWTLWSHASCRHQCDRTPDALFDLHPPELWRNPEKKFWDKSYLAWLQQNHIPIYMQERYKDIPASLRYPIERVLTEFPKGYMTNHVAYMVALALQQGATHIALYGCHYDSDSEYGPQRGCAEYWCGLAEGRGVHVLIPPGCDLLLRPSLLYGYQSHPNGRRDPSYSFFIGPKRLLTEKERELQKRIKAEAGGVPEKLLDEKTPLVPIKDGGDQFQLVKPPDGEATATDRSTASDFEKFLRHMHDHQGWNTTAHPTKDK